MGFLDVLRPSLQQSEASNLSAFTLERKPSNNNGSKPSQPSIEQLEMGKVVVLYKDSKTVVTFQPHPQNPCIAFVSETEKDKKGVVTGIVNHEWKPSLMTENPTDELKDRVFGRINRADINSGHSHQIIAPGVNMSPDLLSIQIPEGKIIFDRNLL